MSAVERYLRPQTVAEEAHSAPFNGGVAQTAEDLLTEAQALIAQAIDQLTPPAYYGADSWWERAHDWLEKTARTADSGTE